MDRFRGGLLAWFAAVALLAAACGGAATTPSPAPTAALTPAPTATVTNVDVTLQEWAIAVSSATVPAGLVHFVVTNTGPDDVHEFVIIRTDISFIALPTDATGAAEEEGAGMEPVDEVEDVAVGATQSLDVELEPGTYALICNIYNADEHEAHYQMGMRASLTVTQ